MKKPITIPNVDIELYDALKERCKQDGTSISTYFNSLLAGQTPTIDESKKIKELTAQTVQLTEQLARAKRYIAEQEKEQSKHADEYTELEVENKKLLDYNDELKQNQTAKDAELEEAKKALETLKNQIESLRKASSDNGVFVELSPLELALINYVAESEQTRHKGNNIITPATLLKTMFVNYTIHGDMYFFPHPSRSTLRDLKAKIEAQNQEKNEEKTHE